MGHYQILPATRVGWKTSSAHDKFGEKGRENHIEEEDKLRFKYIEIYVLPLCYAGAGF